MENIFRAIPHVIIIITQAKATQASLESKLYRQVLVARHHSYISFTQRITLCGGPVLHPFIHRRHIIKYLRSKGSSQFQRHFPEIMSVVQRHIRTVKTRFPLLSFHEMRNIPVQPVQRSHDSQTVFRRNIPQITSFQVHIVQRTVSRTDIAPVGSLLSQFSGHRLHRSGFPGSQRTQIRRIINGLLRSRRLLHLGHDIHLKGIHHLGVVLIFHYHRPVQCRIFLPSILRTYRSCGPQTGANQYRTYVFHLTLHF